MSEFDKGYQAAIDALREQLKGKSNNGSSNNGNNGNNGSDDNGSGQIQGTGTDGKSAQAPQLNSADQKKANDNAAKQGSGKSQANTRARQEAAEAGGGDKAPGGVISQRTGAEIAASEGYEKDYCDVFSDSELHNQWQEAAFEANSKDNSPGKGAFLSKINDLYRSKHDWKSELKKFIGHALSKVDLESRYGSRKWLVRDEIKKYSKPGEHDMDSIIFLIDCSGSMSDTRLKRVVSECYSIVQQKHIHKVTYCYYDDGIRNIETTESLKDAGKLNPDAVKRMRNSAARPGSEIHGRGGNNETRALKDLEQMYGAGRRGKIELLMWFTDGYVHSKPTCPRWIKNLIWVIDGDTGFKAEDGSRVIILPPGELEK